MKRIDTIHVLKSPSQAPCPEIVCVRYLHKREHCASEVRVKYHVCVSSEAPVSAINLAPQQVRPNGSSADGSPAQVTDTQALGQ